MREKLRDSWATECSTPEGTGRINVFLGLNKVTLDIIGLTGTHHSQDLGISLECIILFRLQLSTRRRQRPSKRTRRCIISDVHGTHA